MKSQICTTYTLLNLWLKVNADALLYQVAWGIYPMLFYCWDTVSDADPTVKQHWMKVSSCLLSYHIWCKITQKCRTITGTMQRDDHSDAYYNLGTHTDLLHLRIFRASEIYISGTIALWWAIERVRKWRQPENLVIWHTSFTCWCSDLNVDFCFSYLCPEHHNIIAWQCKRFNNYKTLFSYSRNSHRMIQNGHTREMS